MLSGSAREASSDEHSALELEFNLKLLLFGVMAEYNGLHLEREAEQDSARSSEGELRRNFLDKISYLCDTDKGGKTVTAGALEKLLHGNVLWLAANEGISEEIKGFAEWILDQLRTLTSENK